MCKKRTRLDSAYAPPLTSALCVNKYKMYLTETSLFIYLILGSLAIYKFRFLSCSESIIKRAIYYLAAMFLSAAPVYYVKKHIFNPSSISITLAIACFFGFALLIGICSKNKG